MKNIRKLALTLLLASVATSVSADDKAGKDFVAPPEPAYDTATVIAIEATVIEARLVPENQPLAGLHLMLWSGSETFDVYVGPSDFVKLFDVTFTMGDETEVIGSKVRFNGTVVVLAREVRRGSITLPLRDHRGLPFWNYSVMPPRDPTSC
ncbi:MAG: hypothetical protein ABSB35_26010 [Bryobacteraceae bacterium]